MITMKIRHKVLAERGLESPIKFTVLPRVELTFDEKGIAEVTDKIGEKLLKEQPKLYELIGAQSDAPKEMPKETRVPKKLPKVEPKIEEVSKETEFVKQITE